MKTNTLCQQTISAKQRSRWSSSSILSNDQRLDENVIVFLHIHNCIY